ncbi:ComF family protein [uncultured Limosilactobacillus sp.]|uniref:ComF family protein n=1 Tax=uncultured Limosilactobacillus sp. TaxID=2837629 RepID=UPI0025DAA1DE|nr:phosphoribosyltransferase family protein [uncultured Limosilactobacillus sp.]
MRKCLICERTIHHQRTIADLLLLNNHFPVICSACDTQFEKIGLTNRCQGCGRQRGLMCHDCQRWQKTMGFLLHNRSLYHYNAAMKQYMHDYKFMGDYRLRLVFMDELSQLVTERRPDLILPIPVDEYTCRTRGFNQVEGMLNIHVDRNILLTRQVAKVTPQSAKSRQERLRTAQPFKLVQPELLLNKRIVIVDDIYTTGRTLYYAATLCRQAGCQQVWSVTLAS